VNYYERHLGDYARDAGHLSMLEHGSYALLLDRYYTTEQGIPQDQAHRVCRARSRDEREAVDTVLAEFFILTDGVCINGRAEREIVKMRAKVEAARTNGARGGRPRTIPGKTQQKPSGLSLGSVSVTQPITQKKAHQTPDTRHQEEIQVANATSSAEPPPAGLAERTPEIPCPYGQIVEAYHAALPGLPRVRDIGDKRRRVMQGFWRWVLTSRSMDGERRATTGGEAIDYVRRYFGQAAENDFLLGRRTTSGEHAGWKADIDFLLGEKGRKHVLERTAEAA
jgi:uncharacterized protein YdaU (DUF1376 family)